MDDEEELNRIGDAVVEVSRSRNIRCSTIGCERQALYMTDEGALCMKCYYRK